MKIQKSRIKIYPVNMVLALLFLVAGLSACLSPGDTLSPTVEIKQTVSQDDSENLLPEKDQVTPAVDAEESPPADVEEPPSPVVEEPAPQPDPMDPAAIQQGWADSPHAATFVEDDAGKNNMCAKCHAPLNWLPSMDDLPESCFACKFELEDPPSYIPDDEWVDVPCKICHKMDKKDNILPEYVWLEIAPLDEYAEVATPSELCQKCHNMAANPGHAVALVGGGHVDYECTACHDAHTTNATCGGVDCHDAVIDPAIPIAGHDEDHQNVSCAACHDADGLIVGPSEDTGVWTTFITVNSGEETKNIAFTSHNIVLEALCDRCHYTDNPWELSESVSSP